MIKRVRLRNWRSHLNSTLEFLPGTNVLVGKLGSGKSSVVDAICFALFGTFPDLQARKLKLEDVIMRKPIRQERAEVELWFEVDGSEYSVKRVVEKGKGTAYSELRRDGKLIEAPTAKRVTELVESILKMNFELFSKAVYSEQNALDYFLLLPRGRRMQKIDSLLALDRFEKARTNAVSVVNKLVERKLARQTVLEATDVEDLKRLISELKASLDDLRSKREEGEKQLSSLSSKAKRLEAEVSRLKEIREMLQSLRKEAKGIEGAMEEISHALESLEKELEGVGEEELNERFERLRAEAEEIAEKLKEMVEHQDSLRKKLSDTQARLGFIEREKIVSLAKELEAKEKLEAEARGLRESLGAARPAALRKAIEALTTEIEGTKARIEALNQVIEQLSSASKRCPVCEAELSDDKREKLIEAKRAEISSLDGKLEDLRAKRESEAKRLRELEEASKRLMELEARIENIEELRGELKKSKRVVGELNQAISELEDKLKGVETDVKRLQGLEESKREEERKLEMLRLHLQDLKEKRSRLAELNDQRKKVGERIGELEGQIVGKDVEKLEEELRQTLESKSLIKGELEGVERLVEEKIKRASELEQQLDSVLKLRQEVEKLDGLIKQLKIFSQALQATQVELREEFIQTVNHTMRQIWPTLYPYKDFVGIRLSIQEGDYVLQLQTRDGSWVDVEGMASGGERSIACLALRVAFSLVLVPHLQYLILDEPTVNLDATAINQLATVLRERVSNFVRQAFVITHQKELEESATGSLYKLERDKMEDGATKVVHIA